MVFATPTVTRAQDAEAMRAVLVLVGGTRQTADILPTLGLVVVAMGVTQAATRGRGRAVLVVTAMPQRRLLEGLVAPVRGKEGDRLWPPGLRALWGSDQ